ncbi:DUF3151 family protein [Paenarthrobacter sp. PH39-S1]|uniref:DUF3151 family protein n=1 Tax=Micrococcaceae TaxID=1268 RepID=UPI0024B90DE0|nr:DUF3151 family protein [Paenarthrobacter sp. PH39-S1]MDJ0358465.1 DUF3151 family protein [Paenarthrobacter sp. PH39-S1]
MSDEFCRNLMGPEPTLLPAEEDIQARLAAGDEAVDLAAKHPTSSLLWAILAESECYHDPGQDFCTKNDPTRTKNNAIRRLQVLGYNLTLTTPEVAQGGCKVICGPAVS